MLSGKPPPSFFHINTQIVCWKELTGFNNKHSCSPYSVEAQFIHMDCSHSSQGSVEDSNFWPSWEVSTFTDCNAGLPFQMKNEFLYRIKYRCHENNWYIKEYSHAYFVSWEHIRPIFSCICIWSDHYLAIFYWALVKSTKNPVDFIFMLHLQWKNKYTLISCQIGIRHKASITCILFFIM